MRSVPIRYITAALYYVAAAAAAVGGFVVGAIITASTQQRAEINYHFSPGRFGFVSER